MTDYYRDPEWWDNRRPSSRSYKESGHGGKKLIRMDVFHSTEKLGEVEIRADEVTEEVTLAIPQRKR
jgi:hypothetical protein